MSSQARLWRPTGRILLALWSGGFGGVAPGSAQSVHAGTSVQAMMHNVDYHVDETIVLHISYLRGRLEPVRANAPVILDDGKSFVLAIDSARVRVSAEAIGALLNRYAFAYSGAPLRHLRITVEGNRLRQRGRMNGMPFNLLSEVTVTPAGELRLHTVSIKAFGIPVKGVMGFLGMRLEKMLDLSKAKGIRAEQNDLLISPMAIVPPPLLRGHLAAIELADSSMVQVFRPEHGPAPAPLLRPDNTAMNYLYFRGGSLRFGLLTMTPADLFIEDADPTNPFDVYLAHYNDQLIAGFSRNTASYGLITTMPDYRALKQGAHRIALPKP